MNDTKKTKKQLIEELAAARAREEALRESEETFRALADNANDGIMIAAGRGGAHVYANRRMAEITGYSVPELLKTTMAGLVHPDQLEEVRERFQRRLEGKPAPRQYEIVFVRKDGKSVPLEMTSAKTVWRGQPAIIVVFRDITKRERAEEALRESEERYRAFSDATTEGMLLHKDGITIDVNQSFLDMYGYDDPSELIGENAVELTLATPEDREKMLQKIKSGATGPYEAMAKRADDGTTFPIEINVRQIHYKGEIVRVGLIMDITERKQAEAERERLQQEIIEAQKRAIQELSTPVIPVMNAPGGAGGIIVMPLIGSIDSMRARDITRSLLAGISEHRAKVVIVDITGVPLVDSGVANHLNKTIQAARLKGTRTIITGISDAVAETIVDLGIDWSEIETLRDLQTGLVVALSSVGIRLVR